MPNNLPKFTLQSSFPSVGFVTWFPFLIWLCALIYSSKCSILETPVKQG